MAVFEVFRSDDDGVTWTNVLNTIDGTFPCGGEDRNGRLWCFYVHDAGGGDFDLRMVYSEDQGATWSSPADIILLIDEGALSFWMDEFGFLWISYWKSGVPYVAFRNPSDPATTWTSRLVS